MCEPFLVYNLTPHGRRIARALELVEQGVPLETACLRAKVKAQDLSTVRQLAGEPPKPTTEVRP